MLKNVEPTQSIIKMILVVLCGADGVSLESFSFEKQVPKGDTTCFLASIFNYNGVGETVFGTLVGLGKHIKVKLDFVARSCLAQGVIG